MSKFLSFLIFLLILSFKLNSQTCEDVSVELTAVVQNSPARITLNWAVNSSTTITGFNVYRKFKAGSNFNSLLATLSPTATQFVDTNVIVGIQYEYEVMRVASPNGYGYILSGIEIPVVENRGNLILLIDSTFTTPLSNELKRLTDDLEGDGWNVMRHDVLRTGSVTHVKSLILSDYYTDPGNTKAVFIFGHVPVPYSGNQAPDGHGDHMGAWPTDTYYADVNGIWTDNTVTSTTLSPPRTQNVPGDGKFDQSMIPSDVELEVGRVDLWGLTSFTNTEQQLLQNYLNKDHDYRKKVFATIKRAVISDNFGYFGGDAFAAIGWKNFSPLVGTANVSANNYFTTMSSGNYLWSYGCGGGSYASCGGVGTTANFAASNLDGIFTVLFGSYFGDFDIQDNFLRAPLAQGRMLTNVWGGRPIWMFHHMAMGENIGYCARVSQNNSGLYLRGGVTEFFYTRGVQTCLLGDPSLRNDIVSPVSNVVAAKAGLNCNISWSASTQTNVLGYNVYMKNDSNKVYSRINANLITGLTYTDNCLIYPGVYKYMVRAVVLENTPSGTYYNMSEGIADTAMNNSYLKINLSASSSYTPSAYTVTFTAGGSNISAYSWNFGDGATSSQQNPVHTYSTNASYTVSVVASNSCYSDTAYLYNSFTVGFNEFSNNEKLVSIFPNPSSDKITVTISDLNIEVNNLSVYNSEGQLVYTSAQGGNKNEVDVSNFKRGLYLLQLSDKNNNHYLNKFIIE